MIFLQTFRAQLSESGIEEKLGRSIQMANAASAWVHIFRRMSHKCGEWVRFADSGLARVGFWSYQLPPLTWMKNRNFCPWLRLNLV